MSKCEKCKYYTRELPLRCNNPSTIHCHSDNDFELFESKIKIKVENERCELCNKNSKELKFTCPICRTYYADYSAENKENQEKSEKLENGAK